MLTSSLQRLGQTSFVRFVEDLVRIGVIGAFPFASIALLAVVLSVPQGQDVLRVLLEKSRNEHDIADLICLALTALMQSLSVWYCLRWLLTGQFSGLPLQIPEGHWLRRWIPRVGGASIPASIALSLAFIPNRHPVDWIWIGGFIALAVALIVFFIGRRMLLDTLGDQRAQVAPHVALPPGTVRIMAWALALSFAITGIFIAFPVTAPRALGAAALLPLALASINLFGSMLLTWLPLKNGLPILTLAVLVWATICGLFNDNHRVRTTTALPGSLETEQRPTLEEQFVSWSARHNADGSAPYVVIATEGGGIRAAFWTAAILEELSHRIPGLSSRIFAVSGVSGGSLGASAWLASLPPTDRAATSACTATQSLQGDYLAPAIAGVLFGDAIQRFLPFKFPRQILDRSRAIEESWADAFDQCPEQRMWHTLREIYSKSVAPDLPSVFLNTTIVETGQRAIQSNVQVQFDDAVDLQAAKFSSAYQPLAGVTHNSARFPLISPAGTVLEFNGKKWAPRYRVVDGGYFDNSGAATAFDIIHQLQTSKSDDVGKRRPILLIIRNDADAENLCATPDCRKLIKAAGDQKIAATQLVEKEKAKRCSTTAGTKPGNVGPSSILPETSSIILGLYNARSAHARLAALAAVRELAQSRADASADSATPAAVYELAFHMPDPCSDNDVAPPLGWVLSNASQATMRKSAATLASSIADDLAALLHLQAFKAPWPDAGR
ncbi:MAG: hypothetical protein JWQ90_3307 [Hydrocarboniphaga sp.]|uniref:hypothetical protein n=1 Tax=Hydrocarboniphaga sp. TaxID=2033016 RepID=UPI00260F0FC3|nr:hypothetical protein [Hydrocarboniphaga sp.]MDB5970857.1 hypothetical protein [Hydrocarboniphaga sp.]